jgi:hypothetical protein
MNAISTLPAILAGASFALFSLRKMGAKEDFARNGANGHA